ncbi:MAG: hypothetical protein HIU89_15745 [Proteobacteria bacterium]|nr:hypothetical protein [Pseudomonadota bacterium]
MRPPKIEDRLMPGHWEGDLIKGVSSKPAVGVLVKNSSRPLLLVQMPDASALAGFTAMLQSIVAPLRQYLPKGADLSVCSQTDLNAIADSLNGSPRAAHDFLSRLDAFAQMLVNTHETPFPFINQGRCASRLKPAGPRKY